ncbi:Kelch-type beta propeller [Phaffia rhodozyma]|uniref:Kelch-type beta propeller n=1 Tax=Phaffia rhodozyma TaxID=264483 RepID=A0A0F7SQM6_PHARH|nr:Kelch-type beta propeller [Phaffia rhodozyma]
MLALPSLPLFLLLLSSVLGIAHATVSPRWGHSVALLSSSSTLIISSGRTTSVDGQTYTSSPLVTTYLSIPLSSSFDLTSSAELSASTTPALTENQAPGEAWGSAEALDNGNVLIFGGQLSSDASVVAGQDSAWIMTTSNGGPFVQQTSGWGGEPTRRMGGASCTLGTDTYFTAGVQPDGSNNPTLTTYVFSSESSTFTILSGASIPTALISPSLHCLSNGTLLLFGGYSPSLSSLPPLSTAYTLDTSDTNPAWKTITLGKAQNTVPTGRRGHLGVTFGSRNAIFVHGGGTGSNGLEQVVDDAWILDVNEGTWTEIQPTGTAPGKRMDHEGVPIGNSQILFFGGYLTTSAADARLYVYDLVTNSYLSTFTPPSTWASTSVTSSSTDLVAATSSGSSTPSSISAAVILSNAVATATLTSVYTLPTTFVVNTLVTRTSTLTSAGTTYIEFETTSSIATATSVQTETQTLYALSLTNGQASTLTVDKAISTVQTAATQTDSINPATYTGAVAGIGTMSDVSTTGQATSTDSASSATNTTTNGPNRSGSLSSKAKTAIGVGVALTLLSIAAGSGAYFILVRRRKRSNIDDDDDDDDLGNGPDKRRGRYHNLESHEKPGWLRGALTFGGFSGKKESELDGAVREKGFGFWTSHQNGHGGKGHVGSLIAGSEKGRALPVIWNRHPNDRRESMLYDEDSSRFGSWPPYFQRTEEVADDVLTVGSRAAQRGDGENPFEVERIDAEEVEAHGDYGSIGRHVSNQNLGPALAGLSRQKEEMDIGGGRSPFGDDNERENRDMSEDGEGKGLLLSSASQNPREIHPSTRTGGRSMDNPFPIIDPDPLSPSSTSYIYGSYQPYMYEDPFDLSASLIPTSSSPDVMTDREIPRSQRMKFGHGKEALYGAVDTAEHLSVADDLSSNATTSQSLHPYTGYIHHNPTAAYDRMIKPSRSTSTTGWRRALGLRQKSPSSVEESLNRLSPSFTGINAGGLGRFQEIIRDPATPPVLPDLSDDHRKERSLAESGVGRVGKRQQELSLKSMQSGRTATSEQMEQYAHMNIVQRNRATSGSTTMTSSTTPISSPQFEPIEFSPIPPNRSPSSASTPTQKTSVDPFADKSDSSDIDTPPIHKTQRPSIVSTTSSCARPAGGRPKPSGSPFKSLPVRPAPSASKEQRHFPGASAPTTASAPVVPQTRRSVRETVAAFETRTNGPVGGRSRHKVNYVSVPRPKLTIANPDGSLKR